MSRILPVPEGLEGERIDVALATMLGLSWKAVPSRLQAVWSPSHIVLLPAR